MITRVGGQVGAACFVARVGGMEGTVGQGMMDV